MSFDIAVVILSHAAKHFGNASTETRLPSHHHLIQSISPVSPYNNRNISYQQNLRNQHIYRLQCSTNANAQQPQSSPPQPRTSQPATPSNPSTHTQNLSYRPSTQNHPPSAQTHPHTSTSARGNATATTAPMPNPSMVRLPLLPGSAP